ncbi:alpha-tocopherol transfer protein-like [Periplaneta americana]|uniref:alpha-tocopherol transfer protein-like n=1 Tax=Periplaneta americana TaxID=6978 RepID=UPI0037E96180
MTAVHIKFEDEIEKNPELKKADLEELETWLTTHEHMPSLSEEMLILFLHSCYYDVAKTKSCIECYYKFIDNSPELYTNRDLKHPENKKVLPVMNYVELPKHPNGDHIVYHSLKNSDPSKYDFVDAARIFFMMMDRCLLHEGTSPGLVLIFDIAGAKFGHIQRFNFSLIRKTLVFAEGGMPVRMKAIHVVNVSPVADYFMYLIRPFLSKDLLNLIHFHKENSETLYEHIPKKCLPKELGGDLPTVAELDAMYLDQLRQYQDHFLEQDKIYLERAKKIQGKKK